VYRTPFEADGFASYADRIRRGEADVYAAYRVYERYWEVKGPDRTQILRRAALLLLEGDPWFLATTIPFFLAEALTAADLARVMPKIGAGAPAGVAGYLRARLLIRGTRRHHRDQAAMKQALALLAKVPRQHRQVDWLAMRAEAHERLGDWAAYRRAFAPLFAATEAAWRSSPLRTMLRHAGRRADWRTYDRWRREWDRLPVTRHSCGCEINDVATLDGLRAVAAGRWAEIPGHLARAADVTGCAHLNTGGLRLDLVQLLVRRRRNLAECRAYLDRAAAFSRSKELVALRRALAQ